MLRDGYLAQGDLDSLTALYSETGDYEGLVEVFSSLADKATDSKDKVRLSYRAAEIYRDKLQSPERAFRAYERILAVDPDDARAAGELVPLYEADEKWGRLPPLYEVLIRSAKDEPEKLSLLEKMEQVAVHRLQDKKLALDYAARAFSLDPENAQRLHAFEAAASHGSAFGPFAEALEAEISKTKSRPLRQKLAEVYAKSLDRVDDAVAILRTLLEEDPKDAGVEEVLDGLLRSAGRKDDLRWLFETRLARANTAHKVELLSEWATLEEEVFGEPSRAIMAYVRVLELVPSHGASLRSLARLYKEVGETKKAIQVLEKDRDQREGQERFDRELELARAYVDAEEFSEGFSAALRARDLSPESGDAVTTLETFLSIPDTRVRAAEALVEVYAARKDAKRQAEVLEVLLATRASKDDRLPLYARLAAVYGELGSSPEAFSTLRRAVADFPNELPFWDDLSHAALRADEVQKFVEAMVDVVPNEGESRASQAVTLELCDRIATLYEERLAEPEKALPYLSRILLADPAHERAFLRTKQILTAREEWARLEALYETVVSATDDTVRKVELLAEVALVSEEITQDVAKATQYYERMLEISPENEHALRALDKLYTKAEKFEALSALLPRRLAFASSEEGFSLKLRLATILLERLLRPEEALVLLEELSREDTTNAEVRRMLERLLQNPAERERASGALLCVYEAEDEMADLVRILGVSLEFSKSESDIRATYRRMAEILDERLRDDAGAFRAFGSYIPMAPEDAPVRGRYLEIARRLSLHDDATRVLRAASDKAPDVETAVEILSQIAHVEEDWISDRGRAETTYTEIVRRAGSDAHLAMPACKALERLHTEGQNYEKLREVLRMEVGFEEDPSARADLHARIAEISESALSDKASAIVAWEARRKEDPTDREALRMLDRLYEETGNDTKLVDILREEERLTDAPSDRKAFLARLGAVLGDKVSQTAEAISVYKTLLDDFGGDVEVLGRLEVLLEKEARWDDLAETFRRHLSEDLSSEARLGILVRLGGVELQHRGQKSDAMEVFREALTLEPTSAESRRALEELLRDEEARKQAASILHPLYEADGSDAALLTVLEIEVLCAETTSERLSLLREATDVAERRLGDVGRAFRYAGQGLLDAADDPEAGTWVSRAKSLGEQAGEMRALFDLLSKVVPNILDENLQVEVLLLLAEIAERHQSDEETAQGYYRQALEARSDEPRALLALSRLYEKANRHEALKEILRRRAELEESQGPKRELLYKLGHLSDVALSDPTSAIAVYEELAVGGDEPEAERELERLYQKTLRWDDLVSLYERMLPRAKTGEEEAGLHRRLGGVFEKHLGDTSRALDAYEAALSKSPDDAEVVRALETVLAEPTCRARAAELLEGVYLARLDFRRVMEVLDARLTVTDDADERKHLLKRLAKLHEEQAEDYARALDTTAKLFHEDITDEATWGELERLSRVSNAESTLAKIYATGLRAIDADEPKTIALCVRTGELFEAIGEKEEALKFFRRAYDFDENKQSFEAVDRILSGLGRAEERAAFFREALGRAEEAKERMRLLHQIAAIEENDLAAPSRAIETYREALDVDEGDLTSQEALTRLYEKEGRLPELAEHVRRRAEQSALPEDEARFRLDLGHLLLRMGDPSAALEEYRTVCDLVRGGGAAFDGAVSSMERLLQHEEQKGRVIETLVPIYEARDHWRGLLELSREKLSMTDDPNERAQIFREVASIWETRGQDAHKAFAATREAFVLEPEDTVLKDGLERLSERLGAWDPLAEAYERGIERTDGPAKMDLLRALATVHDKRRDDPRRALDAWERLFQCDESDVGPLDEMDALATLLSDWSTLVRVLAKKAELLLEDDARASAWRRIGEAKRDMLDDVPGATDAYERALELEPTSAFTMDCLIDLYEAKNDATRLVDLYRRRVEVCGEDEAELAITLLSEAATRYEALSDSRGAIDVLSEALDRAPGRAALLLRLDELYTRERLFDDALQNLRLLVSTAENSDERLRYRLRMGILYARDLEDAPGALEVYREVLGEGYNAEAFDAVFALGDTHEELRADAAEILLRATEGTEHVPERIKSYGLRLRGEGEAASRAETWMEIAKLEEKRGDMDRALSAMLGALSEDPAHPSLHGELDRLSGLVGEEGFRRYAAALGERVSASFDADLLTELCVRMGHIYEGRLGDDAQAVKAFTAAAEHAGDREEVLASLDRLHGRLGNKEALMEVLERRIGVETSPSARADLGYRMAEIQVEFGEKGQALSSLRKALEDEPGHERSRVLLEKFLSDRATFAEAADILEGVERSLGLWEDLARLYKERIAFVEDSAKTQAHLDHARLLENDLAAPMRAQAALEDAVAKYPADADLRGELERLAEKNQSFSTAAEAVARGLTATEGMSPKYASELWSTVGIWYKEKTSDERAAEAALTRASELDPDNRDLLILLLELQTGAGRERDRIATLRRRAKGEEEPEVRREVLREAKTLATETLSDLALAEEVVKDALAEDENDTWALAELCGIAEARKDTRAMISLLCRRAELTDDPTEGKELRRKAAHAAWTDVSDMAKAAQLYEEILEVDPHDAEAGQSLRRILEVSGDDKSLAKHLTRLIDVAEGANERTGLRLELARIEFEKFARVDDAVDTLRLILDEEPNQKDAVQALVSLFEKTGDDARLAELLRGELEAATERADAETELRLLVRLGTMHEHKLGDVRAARDYYTRVLEREPHHVEALLSVIRLGEKQGDYRAVAEALAKMLEVSDNGTRIPYAMKLAAARGELGDRPGVIEALRLVIALEPVHVEARSLLRAEYERSGAWTDLAELLLQEADLVEVSEGPSSDVARGEKVSSKVALLRRVSEIHLKERGSPEDAVVPLERAAALAVGDREVLLLLADVYHATGRGREAAEVLERVIASFGGRRTKELSLYHHRLGKALAQLGDRDTALQQFDLAFKIDPGSVPVLRDLGVLAFEMSDLDRAQKTFRALLLQRLEPESGISKGEVFCYLGEISEKQGDKSKAVQMFERAVENDPKLVRAKEKLSELKN